MMNCLELTVRDLRRRWKPTKERLGRAAPNHPLVVRLHRSFSWLAASEKSAELCLDSALIFKWISLNALYGQWSGKTHEPKPDMESLRQFLNYIYSWDREARLIHGQLVSNQKLALAIFEDHYLSDYFWKTLESDRRFSPKRNLIRAQSAFRDDNWQQIVEDLLCCIYLLRCQLVHGAATHGGQLNRRSVKRCGRMLEIILKAILVVIIDNGLHGSWDNLCYPPQVSKKFSSTKPDKPNRPR